MKHLAEILALFGFSAMVLAAIAWAGDKRRLRRRDLDRVGFMPWTSLFFWTLLAALVLFALAAQAWLAD